MKKTFRNLSVIIIFLVILIVGLVLPAQALNKSVELTDIKVNNFNKLTTIDIKTTRAVKFLYYKLYNPTRLVIDFVGTHLYSQEPERIIFNRGHIKEIQSVFHEIEDKDNQPRLDLLVLKFRRNVTVKVESKKYGLSLKVQEYIVGLDGKSFSDTLIKAHVLAEKIAREKKLALRQEDKFVITVKEPKIEDKIQGIEKAFLLSEKETFKTSASYILNLYENSLKKELGRFSSKQIKSEEDKEKSILPIIATTKKVEDIPKLTQGLEPKTKYKFDWLALTITSTVIAAGLLTTLIFLKIRESLYKAEHQMQLPELEEILENQPNRQLEEKRGLVYQDDLVDKCLEKRRFARFSLPQDDNLSVGVDLETKDLSKIFTQVNNLNLGGIGIELDKEIDLPHILQIGLRLPDSEEANQVLARIIWSKEENDNLRYYGLSFMMLTDYEEENIRKFLTDNF